MSGSETIVEVMKLLGPRVLLASDCINELFERNKINEKERDKLNKLFRSNWGIYKDDEIWDTNTGTLLANLMLKAAKR